LEIVDKSETLKEQGVKASLPNRFFDLRDRHGLTIALVTHNEGLAERADRQIRLRDGVVES